MASLDMGPMNRYQHITSENTRHMIDTLAAEMQEKGIKPEMEVFNNGHMNEVHRLIDKGLLEEPYYINIIFGPGGTLHAADAGEHGQHGEQPPGELDL